ncbi:MAG: hypothetical protein ACREJN_10875 [Nitrospiraceae bacterium]
MDYGHATNREAPCKTRRDVDPGSHKCCPGGRIFRWDRGHVGPRVGPDPHRAPRVPRDQRRRPRPVADAAGSVQRWNQIAIDATGLDHTPIAPGESRASFAEQLGPGRASRAMAIVHVAMFDVVNAIEGEYKGYTGLGPAPFGISMKAVIAQAAHDANPLALGAY